MSTKRESIMAALKTKLDAVTYSGGNLTDRVFRSRADAVARQESPCVILEPMRDDPNDESIARITWRLQLRISLVVRGAIVDQVADPILEAMHTAIMSDVQLSGLSMDIEPGSVNFEVLESESGGGIITVDYVVTYQTARESMTSI